MSLVIVGSVGLDTIETPVGKVEDALGGSAVYGAMAASYFTTPHIVGVVGDDFPYEHIALLTKHGVGLDGLEVKRGSTFRWSGRYENWNQAISLDTQLNVFGEFSPELPDSCKSCRSLLLGNIHPDLQLKVLNQIQSYSFVACDTMNYWINSAPDSLDEVIKRVDIVFMNEDELKSYAREDNIFTAAEKTLALGPKLIVVKRGEYGSVLIGNDFMFFAPAYPVYKVKDPTGAGDSYAGGFMGYLAKASDPSFQANSQPHEPSFLRRQESIFASHQTLKEACLYGTVMAALNVSEFSVHQLSNHKWELIEKMQSELKAWMKV
jgi:sugar/nucleoside kinase (ribokinase family)